MKASNSKLITATTDDGVVYANPCQLQGIVVGVAETATILSIYDAVSDTDTSDKKAEVSLAAARDFDFHGLALRKGLVAITNAAGTTRVTVLWS